MVATPYENDQNYVNKWITIDTIDSLRYIRVMFV
jgi:hypothetical protein